MVYTLHSDAKKLALVVYVTDKLRKVLRAKYLFDIYDLCDLNNGAPLMKKKDIVIIGNYIKDEIYNYINSQLSVTLTNSQLDEYDNSIKKTLTYNPGLIRVRLEKICDSLEKKGLVTF